MPKFEVQLHTHETYTISPGVNFADELAAQKALIRELFPSALEGDFNEALETTIDPTVSRPDFEEVMSALMIETVTRRAPKITFVISWCKTVMAERLHLAHQDGPAWKSLWEAIGTAETAKFLLETAGDASEEQHKKRKAIGSAAATKRHRRNNDPLAEEICRLLRSECSPEGWVFKTTAFDCIKKKLLSYSECNNIGLTEDKLHRKFMDWTRNRPDVKHAFEETKASR